MMKMLNTCQLDRAKTFVSFYQSLTIVELFDISETVRQSTTCDN